ncbi:hypothetical protein SAMN05443572_1011512 [Myxococcus fulvus]|uniref:Methyltransferase domain-containing protein n=1 Tax=Myxococcus fulvus TaxID=33 RepID=A0A511THB3_MYXFU|nr:hypothetical protein [Myxococcus fulvus]GEN13557.1 hypothetical protein MFU01_85940 [Myxococcus fulvus]SET22666.1 hypothetical protein SAMN05443572_1011512 [Myxococcus fulvus]
MELPPWLEALRQQHVINRVRSDPRTTANSLLGVSPNRIFDEVINGGQADFDVPFEELTGADRALLYAYFNQKGHIEELSAAFRMLFTLTTSIENPVVIDLGAGPCTAGLALAGALGPTTPFTYIGIDRATSMRVLGEALAVASGANMKHVTRYWHNSIQSVPWTKPPSWRPTLVILSYLLASPSVDAATLVRDVDNLTARIGRGPTTIFYTNSLRPDANRSFPVLRAALAGAGFSLIADDQGAIEVSRRGQMQNRSFRYALFHRQARTILKLREE